VVANLPKGAQLPEYPFPQLKKNNEVMMTETKQNQPRRAQSLANILARRIAVFSNVVLAIFAIFSLYITYTNFQQSLTAKQLLIAQNASKTVGDFIQNKLSVLGTAVVFANPIYASSDTRTTFMQTLLGRDQSSGSSLCWMTRVCNWPELP